MAGGEKRGLFGKLFSREKKGEQLEPETAKTKPGTRAKADARKGALGSPRPQETKTDELDYKDPKSDVVELEMDIPEEDIPTVALSLKDLKGATPEETLEEERAQQALSRLVSPDTLLNGVELETIDATTEIKMEDAALAAGPVRGPASAEIRTQALEEETTTGGFPIQEVTLNEAHRAFEEGEDLELELDMSDEEETPAVEAVFPEQPVVAAEEEEEEEEEQEEEQEEEGMELDLGVEEAAVTSGKVATEYGFPEYVEPETVEKAATLVVEAIEPTTVPGVPVATGLPVSGSLAGMADTPLTVTQWAEERFCIDGHAEALADFVLRCETPMNVSVEGEPGSGKTSLMRLVEARLDNSLVVPVWFNALDYSRFSFSDQLAILLVRHFLREVEKIATDGGERAVRQMVEDASQRLKTCAWVGLLETDKGHRASAIDTIAESLASGTIAESIFGLQTTLKDLVREALRRSGKEKVAIFVDDLEKVAPAQAVEVLEAIRTFLGIENCVFVVSCETGAVSKEVEAKFEPVAPSQGRAYCDRIFQLSVNVPSWQTDIERYLKGWLEVACFRSDDKDVKDYVRLLRFSVGFNPRRVKRIFNKLVFVARVRPEICADEHQEAEQISRTQKLLFGVGCIESQYPSLYRTLLRMLDDEGGLVRLMNEQLQDREQIGRLDESLSILGNASDKPEAAQRLIGLVDAFLDILFEGDWSKRLDTDKGRELSDLIGLMSTTMGPRPEDLGEAEKRNALTEFVRRVNDRLFRLLGEAAPKGSDTAIRNWPSSRPWFGLWYTDGDARKAWGPGRLYYEMSFDTENQNILTVSLKCNTHRLRELGVMKEQLAQLKHLAALEDKGFRYKDHGTGLVEIVKVLHQCHCDSMRQLKDDEAESAADELRTLVEVTHTLFDIGLPPSSPVIERPAPVSVHAIPCKVCNSNMERMTMKDGSVGYKCNTCKKIYKPKPTSRSDQQS